jgi:hypothetical protein
LTPLRSIAPQIRIGERQLRFGVGPKKENPQSWRAEKEQIMKRINAAVRLTFWLAAMFTLVFLSQAQSRDRRTNIPTPKEHAAGAIHIVDQSGRPAVSGVPSGTGQTVDVQVGPGFAFQPDTVNISVGDTVRWTWAGSGHSVTSGPPCVVDSQFCSPDDV